MKRRRFLQALLFTSTLSVQKIADVIKPTENILSYKKETVFQTHPTNSFTNIEAIAKMALEQFEDALFMERLDNDKSSS